MPSTQKKTSAAKKSAAKGSNSAGAGKKKAGKQPARRSQQTHIRREAGAAVCVLLGVAHGQG